MSDTDTKAMAALQRLLTPSQGNVTCDVDPAVTMDLYGEPCLWRGTSTDSAKRHRDARSLQHERANGTAPRGKGTRVGHSFVGADKAAVDDAVREATGAIKAAALVAREK